MVEGYSGARGGDDEANDRVHIGIEPSGWDAQGLKSEALEKGVPCCVECGLVASVVSLSVHLDNQPRSGAVEVELELLGRMLMPKLEPGGA